MIPQFALRLAFGMSLFWCVMPRKEITSGFYRIQMLVTMGLGVLATLSLGQLKSSTAAVDQGISLPGLYVLTIGIAVTSLIGSVMWTLERRAAGHRFACTVLVMSALGLGVLASQSSNLTPMWLNIASVLSGGWLIGGAISTMLLGHWYLTATGMKLDPLQQYNALLWGAILWRVLISALVFTWSPEIASTTQWVWLALRWSGLIGPLILVGLVFRILKYRNTQSATGVLYAVDILVFLGEATAALLGHELKCPF